MPYRTLDPRTELEQQVAADLDSALRQRGCKVVHHGTPAAPAPARAPCDISVEYGPRGRRQTLMVEVAQRIDATEMQSIVAHLDAWIDERGANVNLLYSGRATSARMARLVRNENERRAVLGLPGRIVFLKLDDLEAFLHRWRGLPAEEAPVGAFSRVFERHAECKDDLAAAEIVRQCLFPEWQEKKLLLSVEAATRLTIQQERLRKDIQKLENKLRERGITGPRAHHCLIYLFFIALYEDKRGRNTRVTREAFDRYKEAMPNADRFDANFQDRTIHHLASREILEDPAVKAAGIASEYQKIDLPDDFVKKQVIPVFENYSFADTSIDAIGAVFEAMARRAEKDNRIGQFFTPETAVHATCRLAGIRPTDRVADPACGTGRFLIRSMTIMVDQAHTVPGRAIESVIADIKEKQVLGCDIDPWVAVIAKMNMYIHGDGKSNIRWANGLTIATIPSFSPQHVGPLLDALDVVVANPPLGDLDFVAVSEDAARWIMEAQGDTPTPERIRTEAAIWSNDYLAVVPHAVVEEEQRAQAAARAEEWREKATEARFAGNVAAAEKARKRVAEWDAKRAAADAAIGAGLVHYRPSGRTAKGGALFLSSTLHALKRVRDASLPVEWRGGVMGIIVDEAVLNTREYATARSFVRLNYFLKAIVSLPREAFAELAKTTAKTSILLLIRKDDPQVVQREPVFFARAEQTGPTGGDPLRANDLDAICDAFDVWRHELTEHRRDRNGAGAVPNRARITDAAASARQAAHGIGQVAVRWLDEDDQGARLDEAYMFMRELVALMPNAVPLSSFAELVPSSSRVPREEAIYPFASVVRNEARVRSKGMSTTSYGVEDLQEVREGDVLVSGIDLVKGSVAVVGLDCEGMVVSKEYFILRARDGIDPFWLATLLRTVPVRRIIEGTITGTSNRTRVESPDVLMNLQLPQAPGDSVQKEIGDYVREANSQQQMMARNIRTASVRATQAAALPFVAADDAAEAAETP